MAVQKYHDFPNDLLVCPSGCDLLNALRSNASQSLQAFRLFFNDGEDIGPEGRDKRLCAEGADAFHHAGAEVLFDSVKRRRRMDA